MIKRFFAPFALVASLLYFEPSNLQATVFCGTLLNGANTSNNAGAWTNNGSETLYFTASKTGTNETTFKLSSTTSTLTGFYEAVLQINGGGAVDNFGSGWSVVNGELTKVVTWNTYPSSNIQIHLVARRDNSGGGSDIMGATIIQIDVSSACSSPTPDPCAGESEPAQTTVWFVNTDGWTDADVKAYAWNGGTNNSWPGETMTPTGISNQYGEQLYSFTFDKDQYTSIIFNNNGNDQSADLSLSNGKFRAFNYNNNAWVATPDKVSFCYGVGNNDETWSTDANVLSLECYSLDYKCSVVLDASTTYQFKMVENDNTWYSCNPGSVPTASFTDYACNTSTGSNISFTTGIRGEYEIRWNYVMKTVSITYPTPPTITAASFVSSTSSSQTISVTTANATLCNVTDQNNVSYNGLAITNGNITITGLTANTAYTFTIRAADASGNESATYQTVGPNTTLSDTPTTVNATRTFANACQVMPLFGTDSESRTLTTPGWNGILTTQVIADANSVNHNVAHLTSAYYVAICSPNNGADYNALNYTHLHVEFWTKTAKNFNLKLLCHNSGGGYSDGSTVAVSSATPYQWNSVDIPLTNFGQGANLERVNAVYPVDLGGDEIWVANAYIYTESGACASYLTDATCSGVSADNLSSDPGTVFTNGYTYSMRSTQNKVEVTLTLLDDHNIGNAYWYQYSGNTQGAEQTATVSSDKKTVTFDITTDYSGNSLVDNTSITYSAKFVYEGGGMSRTKKITFSVGQDCEPAPESVPANRTDLEDCQVKSIFGTTQYTPSGITIIEWDESLNVAESTQSIGGKNVLKLTFSAAHKTMLKFAQTDLTGNGFTHVHFDVWSPVSRDFASSIFCNDSPNGEAVSHVENLIAGQWKSVDFALNTLSGMSNSFDFAQALIVNMGVGATSLTENLYIANIYFYTPLQNCGWEPATIPADPTDKAACKVTGIYGLTGYSNLGYMEYGFAGNTNTDFEISGKHAREIHHTANGAVGGIVFNNGSGYGENDRLHIDIWYYKAIDLTLRMDCGGWTEGSASKVVSLSAEQWTSIDIPISELPNANSDAVQKALRVSGFDNKEPFYFTNFFLYNSSVAVPTTPVIGSVTISGTNAVIPVSSTFNEAQVTTFLASVNGGAYESYTSSNGEITVPVLSCQNNTVSIKAVHNSCDESAVASTTFAGPAVAANQNLINPSLTIAADAEAIAATGAIDGNPNSRWGTGNLAAPHYFQIDLGEPYNLSSVKIGWETACPKDYYIRTSVDGTNYYPVYHGLTPPANANNVSAVYDTYNMPADVKARYLRIESVTDNTGYGMSIWEIEAYGACYTELTAPAATFARMVEQQDNAGHTAVNVTLEVGAVSADEAFGAMTYEVVLAPARDGSASETISVSSTSPAGFFTLTGLQFLTSYTATVYPIYDTNRRGTGVVVNFTTKDNATDLYFRNSTNWQDGGLDDTYRFSHSAEPSVMIHTMTPNTNELQYRLYYDYDGDKTPSGGDDNINYWSACGNQFVINRSGTQITTWAKDKDHFVGDYDNVYVMGAAVGAATDAAAKQMTWDATSHTWSWTGAVTTGQNFQIIVKAQENNNPDGGTFTEHSKARIMTAETYAEFYAGATLTFDPATWSWSWEEVILLPNCSEEEPSGYRSTEPYFQTDYYKAFSDGGYKITVITDNDTDNNGANKSITFRLKLDEPTERGNIYFQVYPNLDPRTEAKQYELFSGGNVAYPNSGVRKLGTNYYELVITPSTNTNITPVETLISDWTEGTAIRYSFKIAVDGGQKHTGPDYYYMQEGCAPDTFVIYHHGQKDEALHPNAVERYDGGKILQPIQYRRYFTPAQWHTIIFPFDVEAVKVYDPDDRMWYDLYPRYSNVAATHTCDNATEGDYYLRSYGYPYNGASTYTDQDHFEDFWKEAAAEANFLPQKNVPYIMRVPAGSYYLDKPIVFFGAGYQTIAEENSLGTRPIADDSFMFYGNQAMKPLTTDGLLNRQGYMLVNNGSEFRRVEELTVPAFECYVLANAETMRRVGIIRKRPDSGTTTGILDNLLDSDRLTDVKLYNVSGQLVGIYKSVVVLDLVEDCEGMAQGVYIVSGTTGNGQRVNVKLLLGGRR